VRNVLFGIVIGAAVVWFIDHTKPGHQLLHRIGLPAACSGSDCK
jgi:hypothetical protein